MTKTIVKVFQAISYILHLSVRSRLLAHAPLLCVWQKNGPYTPVAPLVERSRHIRHLWRTRSLVMLATPRSATTYQDCSDGEDGTLRHLLTQCPARAVLRRDVFGRDNPTIREALADPRRLVLFLPRFLLRGVNICTILLCHFSLRFSRTNIHISFFDSFFFLSITPLYSLL